MLRQIWREETVELENVFVVDSDRKSGNSSCVRQCRLQVIGISLKLVNISLLIQHDKKSRCVGVDKHVDVSFFESREVKSCFDFNFV